MSLRLCIIKVFTIVCNVELGRWYLCGGFIRLLCKLSLETISNELQNTQEVIEFMFKSYPRKVFSAAE